MNVAQDSLVELQVAVIQKNITAYQALNGNISVVATYHLGSSQGVISLSEVANVAASALPVASQEFVSYSPTETATFQLLDGQGKIADFSIAYGNGIFNIQAANPMAIDMLKQNQQKLIIAAGLAAAQDKLGVDVEKLKLVYLER